MAGQGRELSITQRVQRIVGHADQGAAVIGKATAGGHLDVAVMVTPVPSVTVNRLWPVGADRRTLGDKSRGVLLGIALGNGG